MSTSATINVGRERATEFLLGGSVKGAIVVGGIEVSDAAVERPTQHRAPGLKDIDAAENLPKPQANRHHAASVMPCDVHDR